MRTGRLIDVPDIDPTAEDIRAARVLAETLTKGHTQATITDATIPLNRKAVERLTAAPQGDVGKLAFVNEETIEIWGTEIALGRAARFVEGLEVGAAERARLRVLDASADKSINVHLTPVNGPTATATLVYVDFLPPEEQKKCRHLLR
jgi:hypothetical protein